MGRRSLIEYQDQFHRFGSDIAIVQHRGYRALRWTYLRIIETACRFARELEARGVQSGDKVIVWGGNCAEWVAVFWGCLLRGAVVVPLDDIVSPEFAQRIRGEVKPRLAVLSRGKQPLDPELPSIELESLPRTIFGRDPSPYHNERGRHEFNRADIAEIIFTSGTTSEPKGVVITHGNVLANLEPLETEIVKYLKYERFVHPLRFLNLIPFSHVFGQFMALFIPPLMGACVVLQEALSPSEVMDAIKQERVSVLVTVPRLIESLKEKIERDAGARGELGRFQQQLQAAEKERFWRRWWRFRAIHNRFGWKFWAIVSGGATLPSEAESFWSRLGFAVVQGYGLTETTSLISLNHPFRLSRGSIGKALPGRDVRLDASGEILVRGESVAAAYWQGGELKPAAGNEGWFRTGDLGAIDEGGNLYFKGRKKNVIVTAEGMNVYPEDLEAALRHEPEVRDAIVVPVTRGGREEPCAVLLPRAGANGDEAQAGEIVRRANAALAGYQQMRCWVVWPDADFPRTSTRKPRLDLIRAHAESVLSGGRADQAAGSVSPLAELIQRFAPAAAAGISPGARLDANLNLSSIDRVELMSAIEDRYQVDLDEAGFAAASTVRELEQALREPVPHRDAYEFPRWAQSLPVRFIRIAVYFLLVWPATALLAWPRVLGRRNLRGLSGPALVVCNHITEIDVGFVLFALPWRIRGRLATAMNGERLLSMRHPPPRTNVLWRALNQAGYFLVIALMNVFPLPKLSGFRKSFQFAGELADRACSILIFPEGALTKDGRIAPFRAGIGVLAGKMELPVIPMRIDGLYELREAGKRAAPPGRVRVTIGPPQRFSKADDAAGIAARLHAIVEGLRA